MSLPDKYCKHCGKLLTRKYRPNGSLEKIKDFKLRITCDQVCFREHKQVSKPAPQPEPVPLKEWLDKTKEVELPEHLEKLYHHRQYNRAHWLFVGDE